MNAVRHEWPAKRLRFEEEWKREELKRTPFAILNEPPPELSPVKRPRRSLATKPQDFVSDEGPRTESRANNPKRGCGWSALSARDPSQSGPRPSCLGHEAPTAPARRVEEGRVAAHSVRDPRRATAGRGVIPAAQTFAAAQHPVNGFLRSRLHNHPRQRFATQSRRRFHCGEVEAPINHLHHPGAGRRG